MEWLILLFILVLLLAAVYYWYTSDSIKGANEIQNLKLGGSISSFQSELLEILDPYIKEYGTAQITDHLHKFYDYTATQKNALKKRLKDQDIPLKPSGLKYLAILVQDVADNNSIVDPYEFIQHSNITGHSFVKPAVKARIVSTVHPYSQKDLSQIKDLVRDILRNNNSSKDPDDIVKQLPRLYTLRKKHFEPDLLALRPHIETLVSENRSDRVIKSDINAKQDLEKLIERIKVLQLLKNYPSIQLDRIYSLPDLIDRLKPLDPTSYLEGKRDAERMFSRLAEKDKELEKTNEKLQQEIRDKEAAARLQEEEDKKAVQQTQEQEHLLRVEFDKLLDENPALQQQIADHEFTREQLFEQFKKHWVGGDPTDQPSSIDRKSKMIKLIQNILANKE